MFSVPCSRVLVKVTVDPTATTPPAGTTELTRQSGVARSVTVHDRPVGIADVVADADEPLVTLTTNDWSYAVPGQSTSKVKLVVAPFAAPSRTFVTVIFP